MNLEEMTVVEAMERYGGSFVKALAMMARVADHINLAKIKSTWPDYWEEYSKMAKWEATKKTKFVEGQNE